MIVRNREQSNCSAEILGISLAVHAGSHPLKLPHPQSVPQDVIQRKYDLIGSDGQHQGGRSLGYMGGAQGPETLHQFLCNFTEFDEAPRVRRIKE
ncbi:hypothetical protein [Novosphingobium sp. 11B]